MSWLFEDPTTLIVAGVLIEALLAVALVKSGRGALIPAMVGVLAVVGLGVLVERLVVTEREQVEATLDGVAAALEHNDVEGVLRFIDAAAGDIRSYVKSILPQLRITDARIYDLIININHYSSPPSAQAEFTGRVKGNYRHEGPAEGLYLRQFTVDFRQEGDRWLITAYHDRGPLGGRRDD